MNQQTDSCYSHTVLLYPEVRGGTNPGGVCDY